MAYCDVRVAAKMDGGNAQHQYDERCAEASGYLRNSVPFVEATAERRFLTEWSTQVITKGLNTVSRSYNIARLKNTRNVTMLV